jgi:hypothetical protein
MFYVRRLIKRSISVISAALAVTSGILVPVSAQTNGIQRQYWSGISGTTVANLTSNANYPNSPTSTGTVTTFEGPSNTADNYGCRYRGFIVPPTTGSYTFWIASDDNSELWLSTSSDPANAVKIASVSGYCTSRQWTKYSTQQSAAINLEAGQYYYIEALHKDGTQNDNVAVGWQGPGITGDAERPIPSNRLRVWTGTQYTLTVNNDGHGTTTPSGAATATAGVAISISATAAAGYQFSNWTVVSGSATFGNANSSSTNVTLWSGNTTIRANFTAVNYTLTMTNDGNGATNPTGSVSVGYGVAQTISATASSGYAFANWTVTSGTATIVSPGSASTTVTIASNATIRANFTQSTVSLTVANNGNGTTTPSGTVSVVPNVAQAITATPASGYTFTNWTVTSGTATIANSNSAATTVTISTNAAIRANFTQTTVNLTVSNNGNGTTTPSGTVAVVPNVAQAITATPASGYTFANWTVTSGTATIANPNSATTTVTIAANATIRANFTQTTVNLTVANDGNGTTTPTGTVAVVPNVAQAITATPASGYIFANWTVTGGTATIANPNSATTTVTIAANATIRANFTQTTVNLTVSNNGYGTTTPSGTVAVVPNVTQAITATPASGYSFANWTVTSGTATIANPNSASTTVTIAANATIRANFTAVTYVLTITNDGNGTTAPSGAVTVPQGGAQTISATASSGFVFANWTVISGLPAIANPTMATTTVMLSSGNATIRANFIASQPVQPNNRRVAISGTLADANGNPVGTPIAVTIAVQVNITPSAAGGAPLYTETFLPQDGNGITVENGRFVVTLGTGTASADLSTILAANNNCFAEITILGDTPDILLPRTPITASPYALGVSAAANELHGTGNPNDLKVTAKIGAYYVNDTDGGTFVRIQSGWKLID